MNVRTYRDLFISAAELHTGISDQQFGWISPEFDLVKVISNDSLEFVMTGLTPTYDGNNLVHSFQLAVASVPTPEVKGQESMFGVNTYDAAFEALLNIIEYVACNNRTLYTIDTGAFVNIAPATNYQLFGAMVTITCTSDRPQDADNLPRL